MNTRSTANSTTTESSSEQVRYVKMLSSVLYYLSYKSDFFFSDISISAYSVYICFYDLLLLMVIKIPKSFISSCETF